MNTLSPLSIDSRSTDWSPLAPYRYGDSITPSPTSLSSPAGGRLGGGLALGGPKPLDTPPISTHSSANSANDPDHSNNFGPNAQQSRQLIPRPANLNNGNPSPPNSILRSSVGTLGNVMDERKYASMEATLTEHHVALTRFLAPYLRELRANPQARLNRARDKLLKLSASQFQELSTDVFDEMTRREDERVRGGPNAPGNPVPKYLLPIKTFHQKRNLARQKLSTLPTEKFQHLAADVFFEQERRFPRFARNGSRSDSAERQSPSRNGYPPRSVSRQTDMDKDGYRPPNSPFDGRPSPSQPSNDGSFSDASGKPLPKMYQSNVLVPNKGTMVEEDDESSRSMGNVEREQLEAEHRQQVEEMERKLDELMQQLQTKDRELDDAKDASKGHAVSLLTLRKINH
jgi:Spa2 homology domain (SHD) of GIT